MIEKEEEKQMVKMPISYYVKASHISFFSSRCTHVKQEAFLRIHYLLLCYFSVISLLVGLCISP